MAFNTAQAQVIKSDITGRFDFKVLAANVFYPQISTILPSDGFDENYGFIGDMPGVKEWVGERVASQLRAGDYRIKNKLWESSLSIDRHRIDDDRLNLYGPLIEGLALEAAQHPDELVIDAIIAGETDLGFDGKAFFANDHVWGDSGTQDNLLSVTPDGGAATEILAIDIKKAFNEARVALLRFKNDQGKFLNRTTMQSLGDLMVFIPPELDQEARNALHTQLYGFISGVGGENVVIDRPQIQPSPLLTNAREMYVLHLGRALRPIIFQARSPLRREVEGLDSIKTKEVLLMTEARYNVGYGPWFTAIKVAFP